MSTKTPQHIVDRIIAFRIEGMTVKQIADRLTAEGVPTVKGGPWHPATVSSVSRGPRPTVLRSRSNWFPACFDSLRDYLMWKEASRSTHGYCNDCSTAYRVEMQEQGRCNPVWVDNKRPKRPTSPAARRSATRRSDAKC